MSAPCSAEGSIKDGDDVGDGIGRSGGVPNGGVPDGGVSALVVVVLVVVVRESEVVVMTMGKVVMVVEMRWSCGRRLIGLNVTTRGQASEAESYSDCQSTLWNSYERFLVHLVMAISVISVSSDSSEDSVGTPAG
ncbi:hypothetical protein Tco_0257343 [Tanacetum coccineum]